MGFESEGGNNQGTVTEAMIQSGELIYAVVSGTDTYTASLTPALTEYSIGNQFNLKFTNANAGPSTLNVDENGAIPLKRFDGSALGAGDIPAGSMLIGVYDGTNILLNISATGQWQDWLSTLTGWTSPTPTVAHSRYTLSGKTLTFSIFVAGQSSNATTASFTIPFNAAQTTRLTNGVATNSGAGQATPLRSDFVAGSNVVTIYKSPDASAWTAGGSLKGFNMTGTIEIQ